MPLYDKIKEGISQKLLETLSHVVAIWQIPADNRHPQGYEEIAWHSIEMLDLKHFKESTLLYDLHSSFFKKNVKQVGYTS